MTETPAKTATWYEIVLATLKSNDVKLVVYVPDRVFTPLIKAIHADAFFTVFAATREEEALGIVTGAWMGGMRGAVLMQTSGFGTIPNALASLVVPCQIPALIFVSERGTLGERTVRLEARGSRSGRAIVSPRLPLPRKAPSRSPAAG